MKGQRPEVKGRGKAVERQLRGQGAGRHLELKVSTPAHTKHPGWYLEVEFRVPQDVGTPVASAIDSAEARSLAREAAAEGMVRGLALRCVIVCTRDDYGKAGPFSVERLKMDPPFVNVLCEQTSTQRSAGPLAALPVLVDSLPFLDLPLPFLDPPLPILVDSLPLLDLPLPVLVDPLSLTFHCLSGAADEQRDPAAQVPRAADEGRGARAARRCVTRRNSNSTYQPRCFV